MPVNPLEQPASGVGSSWCAGIRWHDASAHMSSGQPRTWAQEDLDSDTWPLAPPWNSAGSRCLCACNKRISECANSSVTLRPRTVGKRAGAALRRGQRVNGWAERLETLSNRSNAVDLLYDNLWYAERLRLGFLEALVDTRLWLLAGKKTLFLAGGPS